MMNDCINPVNHLNPINRVQTFSHFRPKAKTPICLHSTADDIVVRSFTPGRHSPEDSGSLAPGYIQSALQAGKAFVRTLECKSKFPAHFG
jgi:hypothetical protein